MNQEERLDRLVRGIIDGSVSGDGVEQELNDLLPAFDDAGWREKITGARHWAGEAGSVDLLLQDLTVGRWIAERLRRDPR
jgi:hypothetical protein